MKSTRLFPLAALSCALLMGLSAWSNSAQAGLFSDDDARNAIVELRQRVDQQDELIRQMQSNQLDQLNQYENLRQDIARLRGEKEELEQNQTKLQNAIKELTDRLSKLEPVLVKVDGVEFMADANEIKSFDNALTVFRSGDFVASEKSFADFVKAYPSSGYMPSALFWLGNAQYANREYKDAIHNFTTLYTKSAQHMRAPDAMLSMGNCQVELKDLKAARKTYSDLVKAYPQSEAASAAKELLAKLK